MTTFLERCVERRRQERMRQMIRDELYSRRGLELLMLLLQNEAKHRWNEETPDGLQIFLREELELANFREKEMAEIATNTAYAQASRNFRPSLPLYRKDLP